MNHRMQSHARGVIYTARHNAWRKQVTYAYLLLRIRGRWQQPCKRGEERRREQDSATTSFTHSSASSSWNPGASCGRKYQLASSAPVSLLARALLPVLSPLTMGAPKMRARICVTVSSSEGLPAVLELLHAWCCCCPD